MAARRFLASRAAPVQACAPRAGSPGGCVVGEEAVQVALDLFRLQVPGGPTRDAEALVESVRFMHSTKAMVRELLVIVAGSAPDSDPSPEVIPSILGDLREAANPSTY